MKRKTFSEIIYKTIPWSSHSCPIELKHGIVNLPAGESIEGFQKLYRPSGTTKNTGNGEVAIYWLLNKEYGGLYNVQRQAGNESADLIVDGTPTEIKAWDCDIFSGKRIKIGRFESAHTIRRIINIVFGAYNVFYAGRYGGESHGKRSYLSESSFGMNGLTRAFDCALKIRNIDLVHLDNVRDVLLDPIYEGLTDPSDFAAQTFVLLAKEKLLKKIGSGNFIINARPDIMGRLEIFQLGNLENIDFQMVKAEGARVQCSELFLNLVAFGRSENSDLKFDELIKKDGHQLELFNAGGLDEA